MSALLLLLLALAVLQLFVVLAGRARRAAGALPPRPSTPVGDARPFTLPQRVEMPVIAAASPLQGQRLRAAPRAAAARRGIVWAAILDPRHAGAVGGSGGVAGSPGRGAGRP